MRGKRAKDKAGDRRIFGCAPWLPLLQKSNVPWNR